MRVGAAWVVCLNTPEIFLCKVHVHHVYEYPSTCRYLAKDLQVDVYTHSYMYTITHTATLPHHLVPSRCGYRQAPSWPPSPPMPGPEESPHEEMVSCQ